jgi:glycosyltransferase involved in cell wall biosynthesis
VIKVSVVIPTFNRASLLGQTLDRLRSIGLRAPWEVLVVDNNSTDDTAGAVCSRQRGFPVPLRYLFEPAQGRSNALNAGLAATSAEAVAFIDDDVVVADGWLEAAVDALLDAQSGIDYTGGPVHPIWEVPRPTWLSDERADLWGTIAILNYGGETFLFEERQRVPLGANMAVRRSLVERIGGFSPRLGRSAGGSILGQEVPEFLARAREAGARGLYVPEMLVHHHVPACRLTKQYFRRWWYGKGISRASLERLQPITEAGVDLSTTQRLAGAPLFMWRSAAADLAGWIGSTLRFDSERRARHEMMLCYFAGYLAARNRRTTPAVAAVAR